MNAWVALTTLASLLFYVAVSVQMGQGRARYGVPAPSMTGPPEFERLVRIQANTLEWLPTYIVSLWLFAWFVEPRIAAGIGVVWIVGRVVYARAYARDPSTRTLGFMVQTLATAVLLFGAMGGAVWSLVRAHG